jgi:U3 small nucleolar RNA-associated protein 3
MTQLQGRMSKTAAAAGKNSGRRRSSKSDFDAQMPSDDEVDAFHKSKDRLALNVSDDDEESESGSDEEGLEDGGDLLGLSDDDDDDESDDDDDESDEDGDGRLAQRE